MGLLCQSVHPPHPHIQVRAQIVGIPSRKSIAGLISKETEPRHKRTDSNMDVAFPTTESPHHSGIWGAGGRQLILCPFLLKWNLFSPGATRAVLLRREKGKTCGHHALLTTEGQNSWYVQTWVETKSPLGLNQSHTGLPIIIPLPGETSTKKYNSRGNSPPPFFQCQAWRNSQASSDVWGNCMQTSNKKENNKQNQF